jgi:hypothetical protein
MGQIFAPRPVLLLLAAFSRHRVALDWGRVRAEQTWGPVAVASEPFPFVDTEYYTATMGAGLLKQFWAFERLIDPADLAAIKLTTNAWEHEFAERTFAVAGDADAETSLTKVPVSRPLNLDPGYLTLAKLVLASTKDHAHRIYLQQGIFAEVTLFYKDRRWTPRDWTFPDYRRAEYHAFFERCRDYYKAAVRDR